MPKRLSKLTTAKIKSFIAVQSRVRYIIRKGAAALRPYTVEQGVLYAKANYTLLAWEMLYIFLKCLLLLRWQSKTQSILALKRINP